MMLAALALGVVVFFAVRPARLCAVLPHSPEPGVSAAESLVFQCTRCRKLARGGQAADR